LDSYTILPFVKYIHYFNVKQAVNQVILIEIKIFLNLYLILLNFFVNI